MGKPDEIDRADWMTLRKAFIRDELLRFKIASISLFVIAFATLAFLMFLVWRNRSAPPSWQFVALLGFATLCVALPLLSKLSITKDGGGFETVNPLDLIDEMEAKAQAARSEAFEQTRQQISALSNQLSDLSDALGRDHKAGVGREALVQLPDAEPTLRDIRRSLPPPTQEDDPQKGRFGGRAESVDRTRKLTAKVETSELGRGWRKVVLELISTNDAPLEGVFAYVFLHDTFEPDAYRVKLKPGSTVVRFETTATGAFTAGLGWSGHKPPS